MIDRQPEPQQDIRRSLPASSACPNKELVPIVHQGGRFVSLGTASRPARLWQRHPPEWRRRRTRAGRVLGDRVPRPLTSSVRRHHVHH